MTDFCKLLHARGVLLLGNEMINEQDFVSNFLSIVQMDNKNYPTYKLELDLDLTSLIGGFCKSSCLAERRSSSGLEDMEWDTKIYHLNFGRGLCLTSLKGTFCRLG